MRAATAKMLMFALSATAAVGCGNDRIGKNSITENNGTNGSNNGTTGSNNGTNGSNNGTTGSNNSTNASNNASVRPLDLLMVVDNSGSTCELQQGLRDSLRAALAELTSTELDVQIGVTTTDTNANYALEPIAQPGRLQSEPQPVPGFDRRCQGTAADNFAPIRAALDRALDCAGDIDVSNYQWTNAEIECAMYNQPQNCEISGVCGGGGAACTPEDLFPPASAYPTLPKVLEVRSYVDDSGKIDFDRLVGDFSCMSFVGTRGYGIEKGLEAAVLAVSPNLTGGAKGAADADTTAPNHGLIRTEADFGLLFLTDENDCSHDGTLAEDTACGGDVCAYANLASATDSPLIEPSVFAEQLVENVRATKGDDSFPASRVYVASIHGAWDRFDGEVPTEQECGGVDYTGVAPSCSPDSGDARVAFSGDRYERFLDAFDDANTYPAPMSAGVHRSGAVCDAVLDTVFLDAMSVLAR